MTLDNSLHGVRLGVLRATAQCRTAALGVTAGSAMPAGMRSSPTTPAAIGTAPSARGWTKRKPSANPLGGAATVLAFIPL